jgi:RND family efflux transporter MFP subunit
MKFSLILKLLLALAIATGGYFGVRELSISEVALCPVVRGKAVLSATGNVTVLTQAEASVKAPAQGILRKFGVKVGDEFRSFKEGDIVEKGQIIGEIDSGPLPFMLRQLEAELARLRERRTRGSPQQYRLQRLARDLENAKKLLKSEHIAPVRVHELETEWYSLKFAIESEEMELDHQILRTQIQVEQQKDQLERFILRAPWRGILMAPTVVEGDLVFSGNTITKVTSPDKLLKVEINQDDLPAVRGSKLVSVRFFSFPDNSYKGKVANLVEIGNSNTQRFTVFLKMEELPEQLLVGQTGEASFVAKERDNVLLVPTSALVGNSIFVYNKTTGRIELREVTKGFTSITMVEIVKGLSDGDLVVYEKVDLQRDGDRVRPKKPKKTK